MVAEYFLQNLQKLMDREDINQTRLGEAIDVKQGTISAWFARKTIPGHETIDAIATFFKVKPYYLFMEPGTQGELKDLHDSGDFALLCDDVSKNLPPKTKAAWEVDGTPNRLVRMARVNFETDKIEYAAWYIPMTRELVNYFSVDLVGKMRADAEGKAHAPREASSDKNKKSN